MTIHVYLFNRVLINGVGRCWGGRIYRGADYVMLLGLSRKWL